MKKVLSLLLHLMVILCLLLSVQACGSRGGSESTDTPTDPDTPPPVATPVAAIQMSASSTAILPGEQTTISVILLNSSGQTVTTSKTITFSLNAPALGSINPSVTVSGGSTNQTFTANNNEGIVTITASVDGQSATQQIQISSQVAADTVTLASNPSTLTVGGTSVVSATVLDGNGDPMADGTTVNFSVNNPNLGSIVPSASTSGGLGVAQATFSAGDTTAGPALITATSGIATGTTTISVNGAIAGSIEFLSATPQIVVIKGSGGIETSLIEFQIKDSNGNPVVGSETVRLVLSGPNGGEYIGSIPGETTIDVGTENGIASTTLHSGTIPGTATVTATVVGTTLATSSGVIAIGGGIPSEGHFSLSTTTFNLEGFAFDGITAEITALIADRYGNFNVLEGTSVSFYSECGAIDRAINLDAEGSGSVVFRTQRPDPQNVPLTAADNAGEYLTKLGVNITNNPRDGLCTIVAVVDGEEEFTDANANGLYDVGETFDDTYDDIHLDKDDDSENIPFGAETPGNPHDATFEDLVVDRDLLGDFNGMNDVWDSNKRIARQIKLLFTGVPTISVAEEGTPVTPVNEEDMITLADGESRRIYFSVHDSNFNPPIAGTTFDVGADVGGLSGRTDHTFLDTSAPGAPIFSVTVFDSNPGDTDPPEIGTLEFNWNWKGNDYTFSTPISID